MSKQISPPVILATLAALAALLFAWFAPLPRPVLGDEEKAAERMPDNRAAAAAMRTEFEKALAAYKTYVSTHDVSVALNDMESAIKANAPVNTAPVLEYLRVLQPYAATGERYFAALRHYDDELMTWTRSLGTGGEVLRRATWPIVDHLRIYPIPDGGEVPGYPLITSTDVAGYITDISSRTPTLQDVSNVREAGRTIEYRNGWHLEYGRILGVYDTQIQAVASNSGAGNMSSGRVALSTGLNVLLGVVTLAGLAALFLKTGPGKPEAQL